MRAKSPAESIAEANVAAVDLLITDAKTALTLLDLAETTSRPEDRSRRIEEAHRAYETIFSALGRLSPTTEQIKVLAGRLKTLKARLRSKGVAAD